MSTLTQYDVNRYMYPLTHCNNLNEKQKEIILNHACEAREEFDYDDYFTGRVTYRSINGEVIAELKTKAYFPIEGEYELIKFNEEDYRYKSANIVTSEFWRLFNLYREKTLIEGYKVLKNYANNDQINKLKEKAYYSISYWGHSVYDYEMSGYDDDHILCKNLFKTYYYYDDKFNEILVFEHLFNRGEIKLIKDNVLFK